MKTQWRYKRDSGTGSFTVNIVKFLRNLVVSVIYTGVSLSIVFKIRWFPFLTMVLDLKSHATVFIMNQHSSQLVSKYK